MNDAIPMLRRLALAFLLGAAPLVLSACDKAGGSGAPPLEGAAIGGPFTLVDQNGKTVSDSDFAGRYRLVYFGYTYCPDVCPTDLQKLMRGLKDFEGSAPALAAKVQPIFISVDPQRDTPPVLKQYVAAFHPRLIGLTGKPDVIADVAKRYGIYFQREKGKGGDDYLVDHSTQAVLFGPDGKPIAMLPQDQGDKAVAAELAKWVH